MNTPCSTVFDGDDSVGIAALTALAMIQQGITQTRVADKIPVNGGKQNNKYLAAVTPTSL